MLIPPGVFEPENDTRINIDNDMKFQAISSFPSFFNSDVIPEAVVMRAESAAVHGNIFVFSFEKTDDPVGDFSNVASSEFLHSSVKNTMTRYVVEIVFERFTFFQVGFNAVIGLVESYFEDATSGYFFWVMSVSSFFLWLPWRWELFDCFDGAFYVQYVEVSVYIVQNSWINSFFRTSHLY